MYYIASPFFIILILIQCVLASGLKFVLVADQDPELQVALPHGLVQGAQRSTIANNTVYYSFEGIPYAKPPVGKLRFKPPQEPIPWQGVLDATESATTICVQIPSISVAVNESEDCLYVNVYTPNLNGRNKAVLVWIYGGAFMFGKATRDYYGPDYLIEHDVVVVHFNYRINIFGFLSTGDLASPGNYGLKDQLLALKWVKSNIALFGGDPEKITIFGESAGGASVHYHLVSKQSKGLFRAAISESGSLLCSWAYTPNAEKIAKDVALAAGFTKGSNEELVQFLTKLSVKQLKRAANIAVIKNTVDYSKMLPFSPTTEPDHPGAFLSEDAYKLLETGEFNRVPYLIGFNSQESAGAQYLLEKAESVLPLLVNEEVLIPSGLRIPKEKGQEAGREIRDFYFANSDPPSQQFLNYISDSYFYRPIMETARLHAIYAPIYMYRFSYEGYYLGKKALNFKEDTRINGVQHAEEVWYIFGRKDLPEANETDRLIRQRMTKMWTNYAKYLNPIPDDEQEFGLNSINWPQYNNNSSQYLDISSNLEIKSNYKKNTTLFWKNLFNKYGNKIFNTY